MTSKLPGCQDDYAEWGHELARKVAQVVVILTECGITLHSAECQCHGCVMARESEGGYGE